MSQHKINHAKQTENGSSPFKVAICITSKNHSVPVTFVQWILA